MNEEEIMTQTIELPPMALADGSTLTWRGTITPATPDPDPDPDPEPEPEPEPDEQRKIMWHHGWQAPPLKTMPDDVRGALTTVCLAMSQSEHAGTGLLTDPPGVTRDEVTAVTGAGAGVLVGIGGAKDGGITVATAAHVDQVVASVQSMRDRYDITGVCWDLEGGPGDRWMPAPVIDASVRLLDEGFQVAIWSALYSGRLAAWGEVARSLGEDLDHWQRGFYDFPQAADTRLAGIVTDDLTSMRSFVMREDQLVACFAPVASTSRTAPGVAAAALAAGRARFPGTGWGVWEDFQDSRAGWGMVRALQEVG